MFLEVVTYDGVLFSDEVKSISLPGKEGKFQVLNNHAPMVANLIKGDIIIETETNKVNYTIQNGLFELTNNKANILLESVEESK